jgi:tRNA pseudouridine38-40 synthase
MPRFRLTLAYDGAPFVGWQRQAEGVSVQGLIEDALRRLAGHAVSVVAAGRTDAGVHALGQVAAFSLERAIAPRTLVRALNFHLPREVRVLRAELVDPSFHARFDARSKLYRYQIWNGPAVPPMLRRYVWQVPGRLDVEAMAAASAQLVGRHDFAAFQSVGTDVPDTIRELFASEVTVAEETDVDPAAGRLVRYVACGDGFLRHMVRAIAGTLVEVGQGRRPADGMAALLRSSDRREAGRTAPPEGLCLVRVAY